MYPGKFKTYLSVLFIAGNLIGYGATAVGEFQISPPAVKTANPFLNPYEAPSYLKTGNLLR
ncbi:hypothetical protein ACFL0S_06355 [Thermodesulfobacteriota bacterium]